MEIYGLYELYELFEHFSFLRYILCYLQWDYQIKPSILSMPSFNTLRAIRN